MTDAAPLNIHLVGSVPLDSAESTFRWLSQAFTPSLKRLVDGETGRRASWIGFLRGVIQVHPAFEEDTDHPPLEFVQWDGKKIGEWRYLRLRDGVDPTTLTFDTGYADDAIRSFELFSRLRDAGEIPTGVSYQACAGTPLATAYLWISPDSRKAYLDAYTRHLGQVPPL